LIAYAFIGVLHAYPRESDAMQLNVANPASAAAEKAFSAQRQRAADGWRQTLAKDSAMAVARASRSRGSQEVSMKPASIPAVFDACG